MSTWVFITLFSPFVYLNFHSTLKKKKSSAQPTDRALQNLVSSMHPTLWLYAILLSFLNILHSFVQMGICKVLAVLVGIFHTWTW